MCLPSYISSCFRCLAYMRELNLSGNMSVCSVETLDSSARELVIS
jgi:hypothetical protein